MNMRIWPRMVDGVGILRGIEANIKNRQGEIDCTGPMLDALDLILAGFHEPVMAPSDKTTHTDAMIATISAGDVHIISHPGNPKYPIDIAEVAKRQQPVMWLWKSITLLLFTHGQAVNLSVWRLLKRLATLAEWWRWVLIHTLLLLWATLIRVYGF